MNLLIISGDRTLATEKRGAVFNTMEEYHKHWERIDIICPKAESGSSPLIEELFQNIHVHPSPWPLLFQPFWIRKRGHKLASDRRYDAMTVHEYPPFYNGIGAILLNRKTGIPYVLEIHHIPGYPRASGIKERVYKILMKFFIALEARRARALRVVNRRQAANFLVSAGVPREKIEYIPSLYIDLKIFRPKNSTKKYDLIFIGRLSANKGINLFLDAVKKSDCSAIIIGDGKLMPHLKSKIKELGLTERITLYGWARDANEIAEILNESRVLVMPSYNEGGPRVVLEAMACGVPPIATPVGVVPDVVRNGRSGFIVKWSSDDIAEKARQLLDDQGLYLRCKQGAIDIARQFERTEAIHRYAEAIKTLCRR